MNTITKKQIPIGKTGKMMDTIVGRMFQIKNYEGGSFSVYIVCRKEDILSVFPDLTDEDLHDYFNLRDDRYVLYLEDLLGDPDGNLKFTIRGDITITVENQD